jgi:hypothetical protein
MALNVYFENIKSVIRSELDKAEETIYVAVAWFTDKDLLSVLERKAEEGVSVNIIYVDDAMNQESISFTSIRKKGANIYPIKVSETMMHNKFCVIDKKVAITGSYNWTYAASKNNLENITLIKDEPEAIQKFIDQFFTIAENYYGEIKDNKISEKKRLIDNGYKFNNKAFKEFDDLAVYVYDHPEYFELFSEHFDEGYITFWLEALAEFDLLLAIKKLRDDDIEEEGILMYLLLRSAAKNRVFSAWGVDLSTMEKLQDFFVRIKDETADQFEKKIYEDFLDGKLMKYMDWYNEFTFDKLPAAVVDNTEWLFSNKYNNTNRYLENINIFFDWYFGKKYVYNGVLYFNQLCKLKTIDEIKERMSEVYFTSEVERDEFYKKIMYDETYFEFENKLYNELPLKKNLKDRFLELSLSYLLPVDFEIEYYLQKGNFKLELMPKYLINSNILSKDIINGLLNLFKNVNTKQYNEILSFFKNIFILIGIKSNSWWIDNYTQILVPPYFDKNLNTNSMTEFVSLSVMSNFLLDEEIDLKFEKHRITGEWLDKFKEFYIKYLNNSLGDIEIILDYIKQLYFRRYFHTYRKIVKEYRHLFVDFSSYVPIGNHFGSSIPIGILISENSEFSVLKKIIYNTDISVFFNFALDLINYFWTNDNSITKSNKLNDFFTIYRIDKYKLPYFLKNTEISVYDYTSIKEFFSSYYASKKEKIEFCLKTIPSKLFQPDALFYNALLPVIIAKNDDIISDAFVKKYLLTYARNYKRNDVVLNNYQIEEYFDTLYELCCKYRYSKYFSPKWFEGHKRHYESLSDKIIKSILGQIYIQKVDSFFLLKKNGKEQDRR